MPDYTQYKYKNKTLHTKQEKKSFLRESFSGVKASLQRRDHGPNYQKKETPVTFLKG